MCWHTTKNASVASTTPQGHGLKLLKSMFALEILKKTPQRPEGVQPSRISHELHASVS